MRGVGAGKLAIPKFIHSKKIERQPPEQQNNRY